MPAQHISAANLARQNPSASCFDCGDEANEAASDDPEQMWTIWNESMIYCPKCAANEGIGYED